jgi:hypothetical protein
MYVYHDVEMNLSKTELSHKLYLTQLNSKKTLHNQSEMKTYQDVHVESLYSVRYFFSTVRVYKLLLFHSP